MNIVKRFFKNQNTQPTDDANIIPSGQLYLVRSPSSPKSENECLYNDTILTIRSTNKPFNHQLIVWKGNLSDSDSLSDDEDNDEDLNDNFFENDSNILKSFIIDSSLKICLFERYNEKIISWRDMEGDYGDTFEYRINKTVPIDTIEQFMTSIYKYKFERKYQKSSSNININDIQEFIVDSNEVNNNCLNSANTSSISSALNFQDLLQSSKRNIVDDVEFESEVDDDSDYENENNNSKPNNITFDNDTGNSEDEDAKFVDASETLPIIPSSLTSTTPKLYIDQFSCSIYKYNMELQAFKIQSDTSIVKLFELSNWVYELEINDELLDINYINCLIEDSIDPTFKFEQLSFLFNVFSNGPPTTWLIKFNDRETYEEFQITIMRLLWQTKNEMSYAVSKKDEEYLIDSLDLMDVDQNGGINKEEEENEEEEEEPEPEPEVNKRSYNFRKKKKIVFSDSEDESEDDYSGFDDDIKNKALAIGDKTDRAFISRGNKLGVFKTDDDLGIEFITSINNLSLNNNSKKTVNADKMMLLNNDRTMIVQDFNSKNQLHKIDLEYGKIVEDWNIQDSDRDNNLNIESFTSNNKFSNLSNDDTFLGLSSQTMFRIDPRVSKGIIKPSNDKKTYKTKINFKQISTTGKGYIAVASMNGEIRLYDELGKNAKTLLPALGDEILGLTTSNNGRYLLATCKTYLLLIDVMINNGKNTGKLGFERSFSISEKPIPRKLQLKPEHIAFIKSKYGKSLQFSIATFNETNNEIEPTLIITSIGPYAITWEFNKVINNQRNCYKLRFYNDNVIMGDFSNNNNSKVILTLPDNITMASTKSFRNPNDEFNLTKTKF